MDQEPTLGLFLLLTAHVWVAALCVWSFARERQEGGARSEPWIWLALAAPVVLLAVHHATGLGSTLTDVFRQEARMEGWYATRRLLQRQAVLVIGLLAPAALLALVWWLKRQWRRYIPAAVALVFLAGFGALQLVSFHDVDARMHAHWLGVRVATWLNGLGLVLATAGLGWSYVEGLRLRRLRPAGLRKRRP